MAQTKLPLTQERLKQLLTYDPGSGVFRWLMPKGAIKAGSIAGRTMDSGYRAIKIDGIRLYAHRLAWLWIMGKWPADQIDHRNGDRADNCWVNLREATRTQNMQNSKRPSTNTSGFKGVTWVEREQKWWARIRASGKRISLGYHSTPEAAHRTYREAAMRHHGEFANFT